MRKLVFGVLCCAVLVVPVLAQTNPPPQYLHVNNTDGSLETGWLVQIPSGSSDYYNERYDITVALPIAGIGIGSADFGADTSYPITGLFIPNLTVDASGNTPDLANGVSSGPVPGGGLAFNFVFGSFGGNVSLSGTQHVVVQFPPGDPGLLGIGANTDNPDVYHFSGWTQDGYATPSNYYSTSLNFGLGIEVDQIVELQKFGYYNASLRLYGNLSDETGDLGTMTVGAGGDMGVVLHTGAGGAQWLMYFSYAGTPIQKASPLLPTLGWSGGGFFRAGTTWPFGNGGWTLNFVGVVGVPGVKGSIHISNEVTMHTLPDPVCNWGIKDDGSFETGWVVTVPSGSSDYFSNWFNCFVPPGVNNVTEFTLAVMDFGTTATSYPTSGVYNANLAIDPSGWTPDLAWGFGVQPFTFPPGTFASTSSMMITNYISPVIPYSSFNDDNIHGVIQFPPGDSGLLGVGGDTTSSDSLHWGSTLTADGYTTPARHFDRTAGFGIRLGSN